MKGLLIRDFINFKSIYVTAAFLIVFGYITTLPPFHMSLGMVLPVLIIGVFYSDYRVRINCFMVSLPIPRDLIVYSRYISMLVTWTITILFQFLIGHLYRVYAPYDVFAFGWKEVAALFCLGLVMLAVFVPLYYAFRSFVIPSIIIAICYFTIFFFSLDALVKVSEMEDEIVFNYLDQWVVSLIESVIPTQPFVMLAIVSLGLFLLSVLISKKMICSKEI